MQIFISGTLSDYDNFVKANGDYVKGTLKLDESQTEFKMRLLTLISLVEKSPVRMNGVD